MKNIIILLVLAVGIYCNGQPATITESLPKGKETATVDPGDSTPTRDGIIYFSTDNGLTWENKSNGLPDSTSLGLGAIAVSSNTLAVATKDSGVYFFDFQKNRWFSIPTDKKIIESNPGAMTFYKGGMYVGTQFGGVFASKDRGKTWADLNAGLKDLTIRKFLGIDQKLYVGTNGGLYSYNEVLNKWELEYGNSSLQVNGITEFDGSIYIATNRGAFKTPKNRNGWKQVLSDKSLHNISSDDQTIYAMVYNELFSSSNGETWFSIQKGLPAELYTFNVIKNGNAIFAGQWDGVYRKGVTDAYWKSYSTGLPRKFAVTNMKLLNGIIIAGSSESKLKKGMTTNK